MENGYKGEIEKLLKDTDDIDFKIRKLKFENRGLTAANDKEIDTLEKEMENVIFKMKDAFTKTGDDKVQTKMGFTIWKLQNEKIVYNDKTIDEIKTKYPGEKEHYIKTSYSLQLNPLKKAIEDGSIVLTQMKRETPDKKFVYKYTGGNK